MIFKHIKPLFDVIPHLLTSSWHHNFIMTLGIFTLMSTYLWSYKLVWTLQIWISQVSRQNSHPWCCMRLDKRLYTATCTQFGVRLDWRLLPRALCVVVVKLASTPMMDTHDTEFVNWLLTPHLFKDVSRSLVSKHTDFEIILLTVKQWFNRTPQIIVLSFFIKT